MSFRNSVSTVWHRPTSPCCSSGVITRAQVLTDGQGVGIRLTEQARRRLVAYDPKAALPPKDVALQRFVIKYEPRFQYFEPREQGIYTFTQYVKQRPTWYSGAMAEVMQVVGGYGRQRLEDLPENDLERARMLVPERYMALVREQLGNVRLPGYSGFPDEAGQFKCEYAAFRCHGVAFDSSNSPWLLQIDGRGVYAMPLPVVPATTTDAFRRYMEEVGDDEILRLLDRFGGMPSGKVSHPLAASSRHGVARASSSKSAIPLTSTALTRCIRPAAGR
ncbi:hypothetical protein P4203_28525 [Pseudomonas aeruginosa]|nr:hypothetical protein [Pseudomonas aeruginosa]